MGPRGGGGALEGGVACMGPRGVVVRAWDLVGGGGGGGACMGPRGGGGVRA